MTQEWKREIEGLLGSIGERNTGEVIQKIYNLAVEMGDDAADALLDANLGWFELAKPLAQANRRLVEEREFNEAQRLLGKRRSAPVAFADLASSGYRKTSRRLGEMMDFVDFRNCPRVVMVGCGRLPTTSFHLHANGDVPKIIGLDIRPEAVEMANALAAALGYANKFRAELADGRLYDYGRAPIVFLSNYLSGKSAILSRIADTSPDNVQIVVRTPYSLGRLWAEDCEIESEARLEVVAQGSGSSQLSRGLYLKRRGMSRRTTSD